MVIVLEKHLHNMSSHLLRCDVCQTKCQCCSTSAAWKFIITFHHYLISFFLFAPISYIQELCGEKRRAGHTHQCNAWHASWWSKNWDTFFHTLTRCLMQVVWANYCTGLFLGGHLFFWSMNQIHCGKVFRSCSLHLSLYLSLLLSSLLSAPFLSPLPSSLPAHLDTHT